MDSQEKSAPRRRKGRWIALGVLVVLIIGVAAVALWQKNNLEAVSQFNQYTQEELEEQMVLNDQKVQEILDEALSTAQKVDQPDSADAESGSQKENADPDVPKETVSSDNTATSVEQAQNTPAAETTKTDASTVKTDANEVETGTAEVTGPTYEEQLKAIVDKVYVLRDEYLQELDALQAEAVADYKAMAVEKRTAKALTSFVSRYISKGTALERECDSRMDSLVAELKALQKKYDQNMELIDAVKYTYAQEKSLKKAWYMSELERRGLI